MAATGFINAVAITPSDTATIGPFQAIWVTGAGAISVVMVGGQTLTFSAVALTLYPFKITKVLSTGTAATGIVGFN